MKIKLMAAAIIAASCNGAIALPFNATYDLQLFVSGATAQDKSLRTTISALCDDTMDSYTDDPAKPEGSNFSVHTCTMSSAKVPGFPAAPGLKVAIYKRSKGGSAFGAAPVEQSDSIDRMQLNNAHCATATATANVFDCSYDHDANSATAKIVDVEQAVPDAGITDVEPSAFRGLNLLVPGIGGVVAGDPGTNAMTQAQLDHLDQQQMAALTFGIVATTSLRDQLQLAQGLTAGSDDLDQMPTLSKSQVASLMAGNIKNWTEFSVNNGGGKLALTAVPGTVTPNNNRVTICRRTQGSGTQAAINLGIYNQPCLGGVSIAPTGDNTASSPTTKGVAPIYTNTLAGLGNATVHWNESSGDVDTCMTDLNNGYTSGSSTSSRWALGVHSLEKGSAAYRFIKIDGNAPTLENVIKGKYDMVGVTSMQWRCPAGSPAATCTVGANPLAGTKLTLATTLRSDLGKPSFLAAANLGFNPRITGFNLQGLVGFAALKANGHALPATTTFDKTNPVTPYINKLTTAGAKANACTKLNIQGGESGI